MSIFDRLKSRAEGKVTTTQRSYRELVHSIARGGAEPADAEVASILDARGVSVDDFRRDVEFSTRALAKIASFSRIAQLDAATEAARQKFDKSRTKLDAAEAEHRAAQDSLQSASGAASAASREHSDFLLSFVSDIRAAQVGPITFEHLALPSERAAERSKPAPTAPAAPVQLITSFGVVPTTGSARTGRDVSNMPTSSVVPS